MGTPRPLQTQSRASKTYAYNPPDSLILRKLWRWRIWFETTFAFTVFEPWEKLLVMSLMIFTLVLVLTGLYRFLPLHLDLVARRTRYHLLGHEVYV